MLISEINAMKILGMAAAVPKQKVTIETYKESFGEEAVNKFIEMAGVNSVYRSLPQQTASDLGYEAAKLVIEKANIDISKIGHLIFVTQKPDHRVPSTAFIIQKRLGISKDCICFDLNLACSGYIYGLQAIASMLKNSDSKYALLITGDTSVRTISPDDRSMIMLFGDSGTATLIEKKENKIPFYFSHRTDGNRFKAIITPAGAYRNPGLPKERVAWGDGIIRSDYDTHMKGMDVFGFSITDVPKLMKEFMEELGKTPDSYDYFALHQANMYIIKQIYRKLKIPVEKIPISIDNFGNNSSNSVPLVLADNFGNKNVGTKKIMMCGFGAGLSWACCDLSLDTDVICPVLFTDNYFREDKD